MRIEGNRIVIRDFERKKNSVTDDKENTEEGLNYIILIITVCRSGTAGMHMPIIS